MKLFTKSSNESLIWILFLSLKCAQIVDLSLSERRHSSGLLPSHTFFKAEVLEGRG